MNSNAHPYIGQSLDFYPTNNQRFAAICVEVHPNQDDQARPKVNLLVLRPDDDPQVWIEVEPVTPDESENPFDTTLKECWGFQHEFLLHTDDSNTDANTFPKGTESNAFVGEVMHL